jgi:hypothetical protein
MGNRKGAKLQHELTQQIEVIKSERIENRMEDLPKNDRRKIYHQNISPTSRCALHSSVSHQTQVPQYLWKTVCVLVLGYINPISCESL